MEVLAHRSALLTPRASVLCPLEHAQRSRPRCPSYLRLQGDALSVGGYETNPIFWEEVRH